ncbi:hypothetical protein JHK87_055451 [Glycine soja]|nr:hypothetical protein JHK87_055451 [Glycine soja]
MHKVKTDAMQESRQKHPFLRRRSMDGSRPCQKRKGFFDNLSLQLSLLHSLTHHSLSCNNSFSRRTCSTVTRAHVSNSTATNLTKFTTTLGSTITTLISIGGTNSNATLFSLINAKSTARATFINSTITLACTFGFHDIDLDWEFPRTVNEMKNLSMQFKEWHAAIATEVAVTSRESLLLIVAVYFSIDYFLSKMSSLRYPVGSILQLLGRLLGRMVSRCYFKCCSLTMKQVRKLCMTGKRRRFICIVGVTRSGTMTRSRWWLRLGFFDEYCIWIIFLLKNGFEEPGSATNHSPSKVSPSPSPSAIPHYHKLYLSHSSFG